MCKKILTLLLACSILLLTACVSGTHETDDADSPGSSPAAELPDEEAEQQEPEQVDDLPDEEKAPDEEPVPDVAGILNAEIEIDYSRDYNPAIERDVRCVAEGSASLQEELENIEKLTEKYAPLLDEAETQTAMNQAASWLYHIWETELDSLWGRSGASAEPDRSNWTSTRDEITAMNLGEREDGGSMYPLNQFLFWRDIARTKAYLLADGIAETRGEAFTMPEGQGKYGAFTDDQGTGGVYSALITRQDMAGEDEAVISVFREGTTEGTFFENGNGEFEFSAYDGSVTGIIRIGGWNGASFEVTESAEGSPFTVGETVSFPVVFCYNP